MRAQVGLDREGRDEARDPDRRAQQERAVGDEAERCSGANDRGQLGDGSTTDRAGFVAVPGAYRRVLAGGAFTAAETASAAVHAW
ncbi:MAG: hypothetical protein EPO40_35270 [Myxococcaceae bacterium]|nr:MAG: hypothetical protein EPO40_35270 [Myxococcaceae bacterium]